MSEVWLKKYIQEAFDTNWVVPLGPNMNSFEMDLEDFVNDNCQLSAASCQFPTVQTCRALSAGTATIHLA